MNEHLAPTWLPRQQRRRIDRELRKLIDRDVCSLCGAPLKHNTRTAPGFDAQGNVALACECCIGRLAEIFGMGLYSDRQYDFLSPSGSELPPERIADAVAAYTKAIADTDKLLADVEQYGGGIRAPAVTVFDYPWKSDDRNWFKRNPDRAHRVRLPFPGEVDEKAANTPARQALIMLVRQVEPGSRMRAAVFLDANFLPLPDDEAVVHALFEAAMGREAVPADGEALRILVEKYTAQESSQ